MQKYESVFEHLHVAFVTNLTIDSSRGPNSSSSEFLYDTQLYQLLEEGDNAAWNDDELTAKLRERLGSSYLPFKSSLKQLNKKVNLFAHKLQLDAGMKVITFIILFAGSNYK
jgi:hypothetical protein